jgi:hypothetical protein
MDKKKSIINIQDLGLSAASRHSIGGQPILRVIYRKFSIFREKLGYWREADTLNESLESFKKSKNKHFVQN